MKYRETITDPIEIEDLVTIDFNNLVLENIYKIDIWHSEMEDLTGNKDYSLFMFYKRNSKKPFRMILAENL